VLHMIAILMAAAPGLAGPVERTVFPRAVGAAVAEFRLNDIHRRPRSFGGFKDKKAFVVAFVDTECPVSNLYIPTLIKLHRRYDDKGVQFLAINSSSQDSFITVSAHAQDRNIPFPVLKDFDQDVAVAFGATRTPEVLMTCWRGVQLLRPTPKSRAARSSAAAIRAQAWQ
jgi:peroxiredoxin